MHLLEPEPERESEMDESENEVRKVGVLYKSYDMARDKRWMEMFFMENTTCATGGRVTSCVMCGQNVRVCTCNVRLCSDHNLSTTMFS